MISGPSGGARRAGAARRADGVRGSSEETGRREECFPLPARRHLRQTEEPHPGTHCLQLQTQHQGTHLTLSSLNLEDTKILTLFCFKFDFFSPIFLVFRHSFCLCFSVLLTPYMLILFPLQTGEMGLTQSVGGEGVKFEVWVRQAPRTKDCVTLQAKDREDKVAWTHDIAHLLWTHAINNTGTF